MSLARSDLRGQSEAVGVVVLLGLLLVSLGAVGVLGATSFDDTKSKVSVDIAQHEFARLAGELEDVASGSAPVKTVGLELDGADSSGTTVVNESVGSITIIVGDDPVFEGALGTIEYENAGVRIAYQGGGVWRTGPGDYSEVVLAPPFAEANRSTSTLMLPITVVLGLDGLTNGAVIEYVDSQRVYPALRVPANETVTITIESAYYREWGRYFVDQLGLPETTVQTYSANDQVTVTFAEDTVAYLHVTVSRVEVANR